ncbi:MAG TPA: lysine--tRNA ligase [Chthoniobacteraceae bacterium]|jgi:lysyl-tRNA synthetase class 1|nr:lysine--tRNA ligase [Chthoniobacteraceae bacterium]
MFWCDQLVEALNGPQIINDSKTPSGRAHVGALRGPLIHDAIFRSLKERGVPVRYRFGVDDYDPVDEIPYGEAGHFEKYLGAPLCNVPPPPGSPATDMADHYITEFFGVFKELGIRPEYYRMREVYRTGSFNEAIDAILRKAGDVRRIYKEVSGAERAENWHPFQVVCENCGRIGTTVVTGYDGREVTYQCEPDLVKWARGCGHRGKVSPFDGRGKLPWKLEWCAKWKTFPVTIEGAGQDHSTKGGSRDVAAACLRAIFGQEPPLNCPYSFFLVGGAKMSSSKGIGVSSRQMADFLPPEILRFLLLRPAPKQPVNFEPSEEHVIKLFNEYDRTHQKFFKDPKASPAEKRIYEIAQVDQEPDYWVADFQLIAALTQMPHIDLIAELEKRKGSPFTDIERAHLQRRIQAARYWIENYATENEKTRLQETLPARAQELGAAQRAFMHFLAGLLGDVAWETEAIQTRVFDAARLTPIDQPSAFKAIYRVVLDRENGPKAGSLFSFLDRQFVIRRLQEMPYDTAAFWKETGIAPAQFEEWLAKEKPNIASLKGRIETQGEMTAVEFDIKTTNGKMQRKRVIMPPTSNAAEWINKVKLVLPV